MPLKGPDSSSSSPQGIINHFSKMAGFQRSNRFSVTVTPPANIGLNNNDILCAARTVQVPSQALVFYKDTMAPSGPEIDIPLRRNYDDRFIIEFVVDGKWDIHKFFDDWINAIFNNSTGSNSQSVDNGGGGGHNSFTVKYWSQIRGTIVIKPLNENHQANKTITLYDAWPRTILPGQMSNGTPNDILTVMVDMQYRYYNMT